MSSIDPKNWDHKEHKGGGRKMKRKKEFRFFRYMF